jgi:predicted DNA-binding transcriptional regulator YafY
MARNEQLIRQHKVLQILERVRFGKTLDELKDDLLEELGLTSLNQRTVRRDVEALEAAGFDIVSEDSPRGRILKLGPRSKSTHKITASATELIALSLGRDLLYPLAGTPFWIGIESFWNKVQEELPAAVVGHFEKYRQVLHVLGMPAKSYREQEGIIKTVNRAVLEHRIIEIEYHSVGKPVSLRNIEPYGIVFYQSSLYIIAAASEITDPEKRVRHWKLDRFSKATLLDAWFKVPEDFDMQQHLGKGVGIFSGSEPQEFHIRVSAYGAPWVIEDPWHPQQQITKRDDGGIDLIVPGAHELEIIPRVLALGSEAELIAPKSCRKTIANMIRKMADQY